MPRQSRRCFAVMVAALLFVALAAAPSWAQSLDELRASGAVGERFDGYAQALKPSAAAVVEQVNSKRKQIYAQRAAKQGVAVDQVGRVFAQQIFAKAPPGTKLLQENGKWVAK